MRAACVDRASATPFCNEAARSNIQPKKRGGPWKLGAWSLEASFRDLSGSSSQQRAAGYAEKCWPPAFRRGRHHLTETWLESSRQTKRLMPQTCREPHPLDWQTIKDSEESEGTFRVWISHFTTLCPTVCVCVWGWGGGSAASPVQEGSNDLIAECHSSYGVTKCGRASGGDSRRRCVRACVCVCPTKYRPVHTMQLVQNGQHVSLLRCGG